MSWKEHIQHVKQKVSQAIGILYKVRNQLNLNALLTIYYSLIYSHLNYCILIWGSAGKTLIEPLLKLQKQFLRLVTYSDRNTHSNPLFLRLKLLKITDIYKLQVILFVSNCLKRPKEFPKNLFTNYFIANSQTHTLNTRNKYELRAFKHKSSLGKKSVQRQGQTNWNELPLKLRLTNSIEKLKSDLKEFYIKRYID